MKTWSEVSAKFSRVTDRLGKPIDPGIFDTVVALNMSQIHTHQSCEGHSNRGLAYPWIDIVAPEYRLLMHNDPPEIQELHRKLDEVRRQLEQNETTEVKEAKQQAKHADLQQRYMLHQLLGQFYAEHHPPYDRIITMTQHGRIRSQGGDFLELLSEDERQQKLREYQEEMTAFTDFLKAQIPSAFMQ